MPLRFISRSKDASNVIIDADGHRYRMDQYGRLLDPPKRDPPLPPAIRGRVIGNREEKRQFRRFIRREKVVAKFTLSSVTISVDPQGKVGNVMFQGQLALKKSSGPPWTFNLKPTGKELEDLQTVVDKGIDEIKQEEGLE